MNKYRDSSAYVAIAVYGFIFTASLLASYVLYGVLSSTGTFENKGAQLGGAAAGFVVVLLLSARIFSSILKHIHSNQKDITQENALTTINRLQSTIDELLALQLAPSSIPLDFISYISRDEGIAYSFPRTWLSSEEKYLGVYRRPIQDAKGCPELFTGNIVITVSKLSTTQKDLDRDTADAVMDITRDAVVKLYSATNVVTERTIVDGLYGRRYRGNYRHFQSGVDVSFDIILALEPQTSRILCFGLHERSELIENSSTTLLTVVSTTRIKR